VFITYAFGWVNVFYVGHIDKIMKPFSLLLSQVNIIIIIRLKKQGVSELEKMLTGMTCGDAAISLALLGVDCFGHLLLGCSVIPVYFINCTLNLLLMPLAGLHFCLGLDF
jgi:hypothetical protein